MAQANVLKLSAWLVVAACGMSAAARADTGFEVMSEQLPLAPEHEAMMEGLMARRANDALARLEAASTDDKRFYALPDAATGALQLERFPLAVQLANEALEAAARYKDNWAYGNAIHRAHIVLGMVALHEGRIDDAVRELHEAGATPGSPQLGSFGPSMRLAKALLQAGKRQEVLDYLEQCRVFWKMGGTWLDVWKAKILAGDTPNFFMNRW